MRVVAVSPLRIAVVRAEGTLVDVGAVGSIRQAPALKAGLAEAAPAAGAVGAVGICMAVVQGRVCTLVDVCARFQAMTCLKV